MKTVTIHNRTFGECISPEKIRQAIYSIGAQIDKLYSADEPPVLLIVLTGAFRFGADLVEAIELPVEIAFVGVSSYRGMESKEVKLTMPTSDALKNRHVIIVEDIVDSGKTVDFLRKVPEIQSAKSLKVASLLFKPDSFQGRQKPDYIGFEIPNAFVVGYGLDFNGLGRSLNYIYQLV